MKAEEKFTTDYNSRRLFFRTIALLLALSIEAYNSYVTYAADKSTLSVSTTQITSCADFLRDPRLNWSGREDGHRLPPNTFGAKSDLVETPYMRELPKKISSPEAEAFFNGVFNLLRDQKRVFELMSNLEKDLQGSSLENVFSKLEMKYGFKLIYLDEVVPSSFWLNYLSAGFIPVDSKSMNAVLVLGDGTVALPGHFYHGSMSHRLQLHLVLRELEIAPEKFGGKLKPSQVLAFYKSLGSRNSGRSLDWSNTGLEQFDTILLHTELFDSVENNPSNPGFFYEYRTYWPWLRR